MQVDDIIFQRVDQIAVIRFNRPKVFNAVNFDLFNGLIKAPETRLDDRDVNDIVITGEGKAYCAEGKL
jgi:enoyl-CoA hydratase/carnithine racemase